ncbi:nucleotidyl transferase AbiEii/AbiGii toxin family protein [Kineococcus sp. SYSU DK004]|uniref:nucleotidyl transferase AbiEii/AbiGii toxin family protein n=1 Tax=Kineococcus sp. SYSU DK004 TaxID=3383125 RepID=UPI003D7DA8B5
MSSQQPLSPNAFRTSVRARLRNEAVRTGRNYGELEREFILQRFLARVFSENESSWILKGGTNLLVRLPGDARHSKDLDLLHSSQDLSSAVAELEELSKKRMDPFTFTLSPPKEMSGGVAGATIKVAAYLGATRFGGFPIDLSTELHFISKVDRHQPQEILKMEALEPLPEFQLYPLPDQVADKVCAMYENHGAEGNVPSTRYRDLVDLVLIVQNFELDAGSTQAALTAESRRRGLNLPDAFSSPHPQWTTAYAEYIRKASLPGNHSTLEVALSIAGACITPLLSGGIEDGTWDPHARKWTPNES